LYLFISRVDYPPSCTEIVRIQKKVRTHLDEGNEVFLIVTVPITECGVLPVYIQTVETILSQKLDGVSGERGSFTFGGYQL